MLRLLFALLLVHLVSACGGSTVPETAGLPADRSQTAHAAPEQAILCTGALSSGRLNACTPDDGSGGTALSNPLLEAAARAAPLRIESRVTTATASSANFPSAPPLADPPLMRFVVSYSPWHPKGPPPPAPGEPCPDCTRWGGVPVPVRDDDLWIWPTPQPAAQAVANRQVARVDFTFGDEPTRSLPGEAAQWNGAYRFSISSEYRRYSDPWDPYCNRIPLRVTVTDVDGSSTTKHARVCPGQLMQTGAFSDYGSHNVTVRVEGEAYAQVVFHRRNAAARYLDEGRHFGMTPRAWSMRAAAGDEIYVLAAIFGGQEPLQLVIDADGIEIGRKTVQPGVATELSVPCCLAATEWVTIPAPTAQVNLQLTGQWSYQDQTFVIRSRSDWARAWAAQAHGGELPTLPAIDFTKYAVVGFTYHRSGCGRAEIRNVLRSGSDVRLEYESTDRAPPGAVCDAALWPAALFARVPTPVGSVTVEKREPTNPRP